jgi:two-component system phosphate regulon sensor histidine kinase PhoR
VGVLGVAVWFRRSLLVPFARLMEEAEWVAGGEVQTLIAEPRVPELAILARSLNRLSSRVREQLREKEREREQLRHILDGMAEGVLVTNAAGVPVFSNRSLRNLFGLPREAVTHDLLGLLRHHEIHLLLQRGLEGEHGVLEMDWRSRILGIAVQPLVEEGWALMVVRDRTDEARLAAMRRDFVANLSHELKTPLAVIRGAAETLRDAGAEDPESLDLFSHRIVEQCYRLEDLLKDLLTLARLENPEAPSDRSSVDLGALARRAIEQLQPLAARRRVTLSVEVEDGTPRMEGDARALERMMTNLLSNAIKYNRADGWVRIACRQRSDAIEVEVRDGGVGIPRSEIQRIFERFYRVDKGRSREEGGSGLGLAIVKHVAQGHGGEVRVESTVGKGSTFTVRFPLEPSSLP